MITKEELLKVRDMMNEKCLKTDEEKLQWWVDLLTTVSENEEAQGRGDDATRPRGEDC